LSDSHPFWRDLRKDRTTVSLTISGNGLSARELHTTRSSVVEFSDGYVANGDANTRPVLGDAHHATASVAFSHAAALTSLGTRQMLSFTRQ